LERKARFQGILGGKIKKLPFASMLKAILFCTRLLAEDLNIIPAGDLEPSGSGLKSWSRYILNDPTERLALPARTGFDGQNHKTPNPCPPCVPGGIGARNPESMGGDNMQY